MKAYEYIIKITTNSAQSALDRLRVSAGRTETGTERLAKTVRSSGTEMERASAKSRGLSSSLGGLGRSVMGLIGAYAGFHTVTGIAKLGMDMEQTRVSFDTMLGSVEAANATIVKLNNFSNVTPFTNDQVLRAGKSLTAFKVQGDQLLPTLQRIGDIAAGTGKDFNELTTIYGKAKIAGTLYAEDINQLIEAGIPVMGEFAKILGVQESQVKKLASEGKLSFGALEEAFTRMTSEGGMYFNLMAKQAETAGGKWSTLIGKAQMVGIRIGEALNPAIKSLSEMGIAILDSDKALIGIAGTLGIAATAWGAYKLQVWYASLANKGFEFSLKRIGTAIRGIPILGWVVMAIEGLALLYQYSETFRGVVWGIWEASKAAFGGFSEFITEIWGSVKLIAEGVWEIYSGIYAGLFKLLGEGWSLLKNLWGKATSFFSGVWDNIIGGIDTASVYLKTGINAMIENVKSFFRPLTDWLGDLFNPLLDSFNSVFSSIKSMAINFLNSSGGWLAEKLGIDVEGILSGLNKIKLGAEKATGAASLYGNKIGDAAKNGYNESLEKSRKAAGVNQVGGDDRSPADPFADPTKPDPTKSVIDGITGGGKKSVNVTVNLGKLNENINITTNNLQEGVGQIEDKFMDMLTRVLGSVNYAAAQ